ncbi:MAG TPA: metal-dependent hydrolase [Terriglobales bacterium]|nr:metal-dependent hydrolase [Terriglobales bacterium]
MEPLTHFLFGACLGRAGLNRKTALATATVTLAAEAPDLDVLSEFKGRVFALAHHRGFTHSFLGIAIVSAVVVSFVYAIWRIRGRRIKNPNLPPRWGLLFAFAYLAGLTHILLDYTNNYGVRPFWPFSEKWHSRDIVFIFDPVIVILLVSGLVLPTLFSFIDREIGVRRKVPPGRWGATLALLGVVTLWGVRNYEHQRAVDALEARTYETSDPLRASAFPLWWTPFRWVGVAETRNFYATMMVDSITPEVDPGGEMQIIYKPEETPVTLAAKRSYLGRVYLDWAKYPITETEPLASGEQGYIVRFKDLRFQQPGRPSPSVLSAYVKLDRKLKVVEENMGTPKTAPLD